jgi:hypothetical protein
VAQALLNDSNVHLLQNPQVRVTDGGKGTLKIGSKIPYVSGSLNSAVATPGSIPYATTQFQQIDVGVNIDVQPHVNGPNDVSMHIKVEISSVTGTNTIAGVAQPIIGQKINEADVRMRDGEYSLLGGLSSDSDTQSVSGLPGFSAVPVLGYLFGTRTKDREKDDILIALVPHIIRAQAVDDQLAEGVLAGTERMVRVERKAAQPAAAPAPLGPVSPARPGTQATPQLPPPGGQAEMLPPTNNPKMTVTPGMTSSLVQPMAPRPVPLPRRVPGQQAVSQPPVPPQQQAPGTEVTPLQGMQQMGLTPDPQPSTTTDGDTASSATPGRLTAGQDLQQPVVTEGDPSTAQPIVQEAPQQEAQQPQPDADPAPFQVAPVVTAAPEQLQSAPDPAAAPAPSSVSPDNASYASIGPDPKPAAKVAANSGKTQVVAKAKPANANNVTKVHLASGTSAGTTTTTTTTAVPVAAPRIAKPALQPVATVVAPAVVTAKPSATVQLLEGHLTQEPESSNTTTSPKQK